ncbi:MAG: N-acetylmuramoyl-L-alanine amidase, partial [bacterium]
MTRRQMPSKRITNYGEVRPGNYFILRNVTAPAILGEASYLTHPSVEEKLKLSEKQRLEAEAYFLGILDYFSRGTPRIERLTPAATDTVLTVVPYLSYDLSDTGGLGIDPGGIELTVNGEPVDPWFDPVDGRIEYRPPWDMPNGRYEIDLRVRNVLGNSSQIDRCSFLISLPVRHVVFNCFPDGIPDGGGTIHVRARPLDGRGLPVADGVALAVETMRRRGPDAPWEAVEPSTGELSVHDGSVELPVVVPKGTAEVRISVGGHSHTLTASATAAAATRALSLIDSDTGLPVRRAVVVTAGVPLAADSHTGRFFVPAGAIADGNVWIHAPGYQPVLVPDSSMDTVSLDPWFDGALLGKRFVINPQGGFGPEVGLGRLGLSGAYVNLQVARYVSEYLEAAGARVLLTRLTEETLSDRDIVTLTNRFRADEYIEIRHTGRPVAPGDTARVVDAYFFPGSDNGRRLAAEVQQALARALGLAVRPPADCVTYPLQQTACPAIIIEPPSLATTDEELRLGEPWYQRRQAYGIFCGVLAHYGTEDAAALDVTISEAPGSASGMPGGGVSNWLVTIDDTWSLLSSPAGEAAFEAAPAGTLQVTAARGDERIGPER